MISRYCHQAITVTLKNTEIETKSEMRIKPALVPRAAVKFDMSGGGAACTRRLPPIIEHHMLAPSFDAPPPIMAAGVSKNGKRLKGRAGAREMGSRVDG